MSGHAEADFAGVGGLRIYTQAWTPAEVTGAVVVIAHGAGEHSGRYGHVAARLVGEGHAVYALDHRGHGRSEGRRALVDRVDNAVADLDRVVVRAAADHPGRPLFLLGHSVGGTLSLCYALRHQDRLTGLLMSGPLAAAEAAPPPLRVLARVLSAVVPALPVVSIDASLVSRDRAVVDAYIQDPLVWHGKLPARTVAELAAAIESFPEAVPAITVPTLIVYGTADALCPPRGSVMLHQRVGASDNTLIPYQGLYHEVLNEPEQGRVLDDLCGWVRERTR